ncbi:MAG: hypothetical protein GY842_00910 [bacterium]|nr:hypothetical protein [bacterium]
MSLGTEDLDKLSRDVFSERHIGHSLHCGECGYNLRALAYVGRCPECGNEYNARPAVRSGIYVPSEVWFPFTELFCALFFLGGATGLLVGGILARAPWAMAFGAAYLGGGVIGAYLFYKRLRRYLRFFWVGRRLREDD